MRGPRRGDPAPAFRAQDQTGQTHSRDDYRGQWLVLYFYPKDGTRGCTAEACGFRDVYHDLRAEGAALLGVSGDSAESHVEFAAGHRLPFPLLVDPGGRIRAAFGARGLLGWPRRLTFIVDPRGSIAERYHVWRWRHHGKKILHDLRRLKRGPPNKSEGL